MRTVGCEFEYIAVFPDGRSIDRATAIRFWKHFAKEHPEWQIKKEKIRGDVTGVYRKNGRYIEVLNTDRGVGTMELSLRPFATIQQSEKHFHSVFNKMVRIAEQIGFYFITTGVQPITWLDQGRVTRKDWYLLFDKKLRHWRHGIVTASHQATIDHSVDEWIPVYNVMHALSGPLSALTVCSPIAQGRMQPQKETRQQLWHAWNKKALPQYRSFFGNTIQKKPFKTLDEYIRFYWNTRLFLVTRGKGAGYAVWGDPQFIEYLRSEKPMVHIGLLGDRKRLMPDVEMLHYIHQYTWLTAKVHYFFEDTVTVAGAVEAYDSSSILPYFKKHISHCYIENRTCGVAPKGEEMAIPAISLGIVENWKDAEQLVNKMSWEQWVQFRNDADIHGLDFPHHKQRNLRLVHETLKVAEQGLKRRGKGEEVYLTPLWERLRSKTTPADKMIETFQQGGVPAIVETYKY